MCRSRQIERAWDCITAAKEVTEILYDATRKLEIDYPLPAKYGPFYAPMEELRECEYFKNNVTDYSPKHIKVYAVRKYVLRHRNNLLLIYRTFTTYLPMCNRNTCYVLR